MRIKHLKIIVGLFISATIFIWAIFFPGGNHEETEKLFSSIFDFFSNPSWLMNYLILHFSMMRLWPWIILQFWAGETPFRGRLSPKLFSFLLSNFLGAYIVFPYEMLRSTEPRRLPPIWFNRFGSTHWVPLLFLILASFLFLTTFQGADFSEYLRLVQTNTFVRIMLADFGLFQFLSLRMMYRDSRDRGWKPALAQWVIFNIPLVGPLLYLIFRPRLQAAHPFNVRLA